MLPSVDNVVEALLRGQECANRLKTLLEHPRRSSVPTEPLFDTILDSFSAALSFLTNFTSSDPRPHRESSQYTETSVARKSPKKKRCGEEGLKHYSFRDDSPAPLRYDGFAWRKYGQKKIKTSSYQRSYFRCAYGKDQNCNATKRVQKIKDSPSVYRTTYVGKHKCEVSAFLQPNNDDESRGSKMIQFDKFYQADKSESVMPPLVSVDHQETIEGESLDDIMNQGCDNSNNNYQFREAYECPDFSLENMFLDDLPDFDYNPL